MARIDRREKKIHAKLVYYGPGMCGKTTNLEYINSRMATQQLMSLATEGDRTIFFDFMPLELGKLWDMDVSFKLYTVPGQVRYNQTRKMVLKNVDGVVFVADSQRRMLDANLESLDNLYANLRELGIDQNGLAIILQYNKRDLPDVLSPEELDKALNKAGYPRFLASAMSGEGVNETLKASCSVVLKNLRHQIGDQTKRSPSGVQPQVHPPASPVPPAEAKASPAKGTPAATPPQSAAAAKPKPQAPPPSPPQGKATPATANEAPAAAAQPKIRPPSQQGMPAVAVSDDRPAQTVAVKAPAGTAEKASPAAAAQTKARSPSHQATPAVPAAKSPTQPGMPAVAVAAVQAVASTAAQPVVATAAQPVVAKPTSVVVEKPSSTVAAQPNGRAAGDKAAPAVAAKIVTDIASRAAPSQAAADDERLDISDQGSTGARWDAAVTVRPAAIVGGEQAVASAMTASNKAGPTRAQEPAKESPRPAASAREAAPSPRQHPPTQSLEPGKLSTAALDPLIDKVAALVSAMSASIEEAAQSRQALRRDVEQLQQLMAANKTARGNDSDSAAQRDLEALRSELKSIAASVVALESKLLAEDGDIQKTRRGVMHLVKASRDTPQRPSDPGQSADLDALQKQLAALPSKADLEQLMKQSSAQTGASAGGASGVDAKAISSRLAELPTKAELKALESKLAEFPTKGEIKALVDSAGSLPIKAELTALAGRFGELPTKSELKALAEPLGRVLTKAELEALERRLGELPTKSELKAFEGKLGELPTKSELKAFEGKLGELPTKSELKAFEGKLGELPTKSELKALSAPGAPAAGAAELAELQSKLVALPSKADIAALRAVLDQLPAKRDLEAWMRSLAAAPAPPQARAASQPPPEPAAEVPPETKEPVEAKPSQAPAAAPVETSGATEPEPKAAAKSEAPAAAAKSEAPAAKSEPQPAAEQPPQSAEAKPDLSDDPEHRNAARAARVMVSDLLLYQKEMVDEGIKQGDFHERNKEALADMRTTYESRVPKHVRDHKDYLAEAIDAFIAKRRERLGLG